MTDLRTLGFRGLVAALLGLGPQHPDQKREPEFPAHKHRAGRSASQRGLQTARRRRRLAARSRWVNAHRGENRRAPRA